MITNKPSRGFYFFKGFLVLTFLCVLSAQGMAANYPLEIIQPQPSLDIKNRFYKAYPGLEYNVRLAVIGGEFPYLFALTTGPTGMTIDKRGEISWANPVASGTPYNVTATVTDAQSNTKNVSWTITVTKSGFRFIDAVNGKSAALGGTGTFANPWKSVKDWYEGDDAGAIDRKSYSGEFLYWRGGTYRLDGYIDAKSDNRFLLTTGNKPQVWLAYPGESPVLDMQDGFITIWAGTNTYMDGLEFNVNGNTRGKGLEMSAGASHVTVRRNKFHGITNGYTGGNCSLFFMSRGKQGQYWSFQDNEMYDVNIGYGILGYTGKNVLAEDNVFHNIGRHGVGPKSATLRWEIRRNVFYDNGQDSIGVQYVDDQDGLSGDIEIRYNVVKSGGGRMRVNTNMSAEGKPVYIYRNTIVADIDVGKPTQTNGPFHFYNNIIVNNLPFVDKIKKYFFDYPPHLITENNLLGSSADNIVDSQGYLTQNYSSYIGTHGHELGKRPLSPTGLTVTGQ